MEPPNPIIELVKALARRRARLDALPPTPANQNEKDEKAASEK